MISDTNSNGVLSRKEKEELVLDLYFNKNKTYHEIAKIARISPRDIKTYYRQGLSGKRKTRAQIISCTSLRANLQR
jgi:DNA-binding CsgD family transcriptional regulator